MSAIEMGLNVGAARRFTTLTVGRLLLTLLPIVLLTAAMYAAVWWVGRLIEAPLLRLFAKMAAGVAVYVGLAASFRMEAFREVSRMIRREFLRKEQAGC